MTNEAGDLFRKRHLNGVPRMEADFDAALAAERRATVERIRAALLAAGFVEDQSNDINAVLSILDVEAAR
jgi:hypothetical protein